MEGSGGTHNLWSLDLQTCTEGNKLFKVYCQTFLGGINSWVRFQSFHQLFKKKKNPPPVLNWNSPKCIMNF